MWTRFKKNRPYLYEAVQWMILVIGIATLIHEFV